MIKILVAILLYSQCAFGQVQPLPLVPTPPTIIEPFKDNFGGSPEAQRPTVVFPEVYTLGEEAFANFPEQERYRRLLDTLRRLWLGSRLVQPTYCPQN